MSLIIHFPSELIFSKTNYRHKERIWNERLVVSKVLGLSLVDIKTLTIENFLYYLKLARKINEDNEDN